MRKIQFANGEYYHLYNRGVDSDQNDGLMIAWRDYKENNPEAELPDFPLLKKKRKKLVEFVCYCLNPNHYHLVVKQLDERGIERFMHKLGTSHTNYFNTKNKRTGALFQGRFKAIRIKSNSKLLYLSAYVNMNHFIHGFRQKEWKYSSLLEYLGKRKSGLCNKKIIMGQFEDIADYKKFLDENAIYMKEKKEDEKYLLE
ncbi:MAG: Transposase [Candidatus Moranbacteria bacterium GW2011_GWF1_44_4]|nr:MAG: Transposase [Candidatus Moranbacteria bacterium GW2011_GWF1_44_4]